MSPSMDKKQKTKNTNNLSALKQKFSWEIIGLSLDYQFKPCCLSSFEGTLLAMGVV